MTDKEQEEGIRRLQLPLQCSECLIDFSFCSFFVGENNHAIGRESELVYQRFGSGGCRLFKFKFVFFVARDSSEDQRAGIRKCGHSKKQCQKCAGRLAARNSHARPFLYLQNHSAPKVIQRSMKRNGTSHNSFCSVYEVSVSTYCASSGTSPSFESG